MEEISLVGTAISNNKIEFFVTEELAENMTDGEQVDAEKTESDTKVRFCIRIKLRARQQAFTG